jgi:hypothetical protein
MDISKYIQEIDTEILGQKEDLIKKILQTELKNFQFDEKNLSPTLISLLMTKQDMPWLGKDLMSFIAWVTA